MTTLRRNLRLKFEEIILSRYGDNPPSTDAEEHAKEVSELLADCALDLLLPKPKHVQVEVSKLPIEWQIAAGVEQVNPEVVEGEVLKKKALDAFERDMRFGTLPWDSTNPWKKMADFVVLQHGRDENIFLKYKIWQTGDGKYLAMSNRKIRENPDIFISCFPDFLAHTQMYAKKVVPDSERADLDDKGAPISY